MTKIGGKLLQEQRVASLSIEPMRRLLGPEAAEQLDRHIDSARQLLANRVVWNINSTGVGGGVAERGGASKNISYFTATSFNICDCSDSCSIEVAPQERPWCLQHHRQTME